MIPPPVLPPQAARPRPFLLPEFEVEELASGLQLVVLPRPEVPIVSAELVVDAGEGSVSESHAGLAALAAAGLDGGTRVRSGAELARAMESLGVGLSVSSGWDALTLRISSTPERFAEALALLAETILMPAFPEDEVDRVREQRLAAIRQRRADPSTLADDAASAEIFAPGVAYARRLAGSTSSISALDAGAIRHFAEAQYRPGGAGLAIVGRIDAKDARAAVRAAFGSWQGRPAAGSTVSARPRHREAGVLVVDRPGSVQSEIRIGHVGIARNHPDYFPLRVFNSVLGGTFTSRLNLNLRERNGFTYGVRSSFSPRRGAGPFEVSTSVGTDVTAAAVRESFHEVRTILSEGPTEDEVRAVQDYLTGVFPLRFETTSQLAARLTDLITYALPADYHATWRERIGAVSAEAALDAGRRAVRPEALQTVVVGDAAQVLAELEALELGPVRVVPADAVEDEGSSDE